MEHCLSMAFPIPFNLSDSRVYSAKVGGGGIDLTFSLTTIIFIHSLFYSPDLLRSLEWHTCFPHIVSSQQPYEVGKAAFGWSNRWYFLFICLITEEIEEVPCYVRLDGPQV